MKINEIDSYNYNIYTNDRAIIQFLKLRKMDPNTLDAKEVRLLSFLVNLFKNSNLDSMEIDGLKYIFISDTLIKKSLMFMNVEGRQIKKFISKLERIGFIKRLVIEKRFRYVNVSSQLLNLWHNENNNMGAVNYLMKYKPHLYESLKSKYELILDDYAHVINQFTNTMGINGSGTIDNKYDAEDIYHQLSKYLEKCYQNQRLGLKPNKK